MANLTLEQIEEISGRNCCPIEDTRRAHLGIGCWYAISPAERDALCKMAREAIALKAEVERHHRDFDKWEQDGMRWVTEINKLRAVKYAAKRASKVLLAVACDEGTHGWDAHEAGNALDAALAAAEDVK